MYCEYPDCDRDAEFEVDYGEETAYYCHDHLPEFVGGATISTIEDFDDEAIGCFY